MNVEQFRELFPQLSQTVYGKPLVYLDNAATSLRPQCVIDKWTESASKYTSNLHRAVHYTAGVATEEYEKARAAVAAFIGAGSPSEIVFTSGATASLNLVASSFASAFLKEGDEVLIAESEHHSDIVPWQMACSRAGAKIKVWKVDDDGHLDMDALPGLLTPSVKICCVAQISNVLGLENPVKEIVSICHSKGCPVLIDGAQGIVHAPVDVRGLDCDFYVFSGHKAYAAPGTGVLYAKKELLEAMPPYMGGGEMIKTVRWSGSTYADIPMKFEAGTQNISGTPTIAPALDMAGSTFHGELKENMDAICAYMLDALGSDSRIRLYGKPGNGFDKIPLFSFSVEHCHHEDLALILDKMGIAVRSGQMCAEPLMDRFGVSGMLRVSFAPYNTLAEAEYFISSLDKAIAMLS